ncbi:MAG: hypothetical protein Ct9H90mP16_21800 [Candidatus Poseidoniales archaeon]|nr:MAG: hypothetical protein Ct9H90mP16_21800 [Candidatus Poseidoniales archaeon]
MFTWTPPESGSGDVTFWLAGNSVNGDGAPTGDAWNRLSFSLGEGDDSGSVRTIFAGNGDVARRLQITDMSTCTTWVHHSEPIGWAYSGSALLWP